MNRILCRPAELIFAVVALFTLNSAAVADANVSFVRLTPQQYRNSIRDVFGPDIRINDNKVDPGFRPNGGEGLLAVGDRKLTVSSAEFERDEEVAQSISAQVIEPRRRATILGCRPKAESSPDAQCAGRFIGRLGLLLLRRPLTGSEVNSYVAIHEAAANKLQSFNAGLSAVVYQMLLDPEFLFRVERTAVLGKDTNSAVADKRQALDAYSRASRLSFLLWDTAPDAELLHAASTGELMSAPGLERQVGRLLGSTRLESGLRAFFTDMLGFDEFETLEVDPNLYPRFTKQVASEAKEQTLRTIAYQLITKDQDYRSIFLTRDTFLTPSLAALYGVPLSRSDELGGAVSWVAYSFPPRDLHVGILSQVSFLSLNSHPGRTSPTLRGKALRQKVLCQKVPPPPGNVDFSLVQNTDDPRFKTVRQRLTAHRKEPMCAGCHRITDPIGLALEDFDTASQFRTTENGASIDATGELDGKNFSGNEQLSEAVANDPKTTSCLITRAYSYGIARPPTAGESAWLVTLQSEFFKEGGVKWRELMRRIAMNPDFYTVTTPDVLTTQAN